MRDGGNATLFELGFCKLGVEGKGFWSTVGGLCGRGVGVQEVFRGRLLVVYFMI